MNLFSRRAFLHLQTYTPYPAAKGASHRIGFFPEKDPGKLHNCKQYFWLGPDGGKIHCAYLNTLEESFRELSILRHYVGHVCSRLGIQIGFNILERDNPWDFRLEFSSGTIVNVEIVSISDRPSFFKTLAVEERVQRHSYYPTIRLGILEKVLSDFPDLELSQQVRQYKEDGLGKGDDVSNPFFAEEPKFFLSQSLEFPLPIDQVIMDALGSKARKKRKDKDETIILIDNRTTTTGLDRFISAVEELSNYMDHLEFPEIWLYTGYGVVHESRSAAMQSRFSECLLLPMKLPAEFAERYE